MEQIETVVETPVVETKKEKKPTIKKASEGIKTIKKTIKVDNTVEIEGQKDQERSVYSMEIEETTAEANTEIAFIATYVNGNNIKKTKRLTTILDKDVVNVLGYLRWQVAPKLLEERDSEFTKVLKVALA